MDPEAERGGQASQATADENAKLLSNRAEDGAKPDKRHYDQDLDYDDTDNVSTKPNRQ